MKTKSNYEMQVELLKKNFDNSIKEQDNISFATSQALFILKGYFEKRLTLLEEYLSKELGNE